MKDKLSSTEIRLNAIIRLYSDLLVAQENVTKASIYKSLNEVGLQPTEIGNIFGKTRGEIGSELTKTKKSKNKKKKGVKNKKEE